MPTVLNVRNPAVHSIADLTPADRIAMPAIKVSNHALTLEMAAAQAFGQAFGPDAWQKLDPQTVSMPQPDAAAALMSGRGEVTAHFTSPPFDLAELHSPGVHPILNSFDVMGDTSLTVLWTTRRFATANPRITQAMFDAVHEALATINADRTAAADRYLALSGDRIARNDLLAVLADPHIHFDPAPKGTMTFARFMLKTGALRAIPDTWSDLFIPAARSLPGN